MATQITINYFGVQGTGRTVKEAKIDAGRRIEEITKHEPEVHSFRGAILIVFANAQGGAYILTDGEREGRNHCVHSCASFDYAKLCGIRHLLANVREIGEYIIPSCFEHLMSKSDRQITIDDWRRSDGFQLAYRHAEAQKIEDCHAWACHHAHEFVAA